MREQLVNPSRRNFFLRNHPSERAPRLPWSVDEESFTDSCDQCLDCLPVCENQIIVRDEKGFPKVDFNKGECSFCLKCIESCDKPLFVSRMKSAELDTENAFKSEQAQPWNATLFIENTCLAKSQIYCQSCRDVCETEAIQFSFIHEAGTSAIPRPQLKLEDCTQCGACISICPQNALKFEMTNNEI